MRSTTRSAFRVAAATAFLGLLLPVVLAHGDDDTMDMGEAVGLAADEPNPDVEYPPTYFAHPEHRGVLVAHIVLMVLAWVVVLPIGMAPDELEDIQISLRRNRMLIAS